MIAINHAALHKIKIHAMQAYPEECCGFLLGQMKQQRKCVCDILEVTNSKDVNRTARYFIRPEDYKHAEQMAQEEGGEILGLYHSHPDHPASPSTYDLEHALPNWSYMIVSVENGYAADVACWVLKDDRSAFDEETICEWVNYELYSTNHLVKKA